MLRCLWLNDWTLTYFISILHENALIETSLKVLKKRVIDPIRALGHLNTKSSPIFEMMDYHFENSSNYLFYLNILWGEILWCCCYLFFLGLLWISRNILIKNGMFVLLFICIFELIIFAFLYFCIFIFLYFFWIFYESGGVEKYFARTWTLLKSFPCLKLFKKFQTIFVMNQIRKRLISMQKLFQRFVW